jgi:polysaccharide export outer membrane protein
MRSPSRIPPRRRWALVVGALLMATSTVVAQQLTGAPGTGPPPAAAMVPPPDYTIGPDDVLTIAFWGEKDMSGDVIVRPDGKITLPLINDVAAAGLSPAELRERIATLAKKFFQDVQATVTVKTINSRRVFITGQVEKPGSYPLTTRTTVMQLIAMAGGVKEFAKTNKIVVMRNDAGREARFQFNYKEVVEGRNLAQNLEMKPGDTVVVP